MIVVCLNYRVAAQFLLHANTEAVSKVLVLSMLVGRICAGIAAESTRQLPRKNPAAFLPRRWQRQHTAGGEARQRLMLDC
jgi:hypothetical protein